MSSTDDTVVLQFGRVGPNQFNMDYRYPLSPMQGKQKTRWCDGESMWDQYSYVCTCVCFLVPWQLFQFVWAVSTTSLRVNKSFIHSALHIYLCTFNNFLLFRITLRLLQNRRVIGFIDWRWGQFSENCSMSHIKNINVRISVVYNIWIILKK